ncbi:MAG: 1-acyl-sn-glycerol-3-phosphate acyltransferase [Clostridiales bacterium]|nr:1-acyl-sn-glycerol-3-phosphate acyltransferase [Clostridiales bacterium]
MAKQKKKKEHRVRHKIFYTLVIPLVRLFVKIKFRYKYKKAKKLPKNYIVVSNHTTDFDPLFVASSFNKQMYFVASEHITRWGTAYKLLDYFLAPIIRYKGTVGASTVMEVLRKVKRGDSVCIFAEGVRSWNGETGSILPSTAKMIKSAKCGLVTYKITGGYFVSPNWSTSKCRKGYVSGAPVNIYSKEDIEKMSEDEIYKIIKSDIYEEASNTQLILNKRYKGKGIAEGIENLLFKCPDCKCMDSLKSSGDGVVCLSCGHKFKYTEYGFLEGTKFKTIYDGYKWLEKEIDSDIKNNVDYISPNSVLNSIQLDHSKLKISSGKVVMNGNLLKCGEVEFKMEDIIDMAIYGKYGLVFSANGEYYELLPERNGSVYKFLLYYKIFKKK